ncbi:MAG: plasmid pRiA4b ORF-3 family protein, partial [Bacteroidota bacterium]
KSQVYPRCIKGKRACPPEDCGGIWGYMEMIEIMKNPKHPEYEDTLEWLGEELDSEAFDMVSINKSLGTKNYGVYDMY